jgi:hypothetical protein
VLHLHYNNIILKSKNKTKSTWKIINNEKGTTQHDMSAQSLALDGKIITIQKIIANLFNNLFINSRLYGVSQWGSNKW